MFIRNFVFWAVCIGLHKLLTNLVYKVGMKNKVNLQPPLYDVYQQILPNLKHLRIIPEILHLIPIVFLASLMLYYKNTDALNKFLSKHGLLMVLRALCFSSTILPDSSETCMSNNYMGSCFDLIFSGHTTIMLLSTYIIKEFFLISLQLYNCLLFLNVINAVLIVLCRNHYTVDVILSLIITHFVYFYKSYV